MKASRGYRNPIGIHAGLWDFDPLNLSNFGLPSLSGEGTEESFRVWGRTLKLS